MNLTFLLLWACSGTPAIAPTPEVPVAVPPAPPPAPIHIRLPFNQPQALGDLGGTVTLTKGSRDTVLSPDGRSHHEATVGELDFVDGDQKTTVAFVSGQAFAHAGRDMAVYGMMSLELVIAPPGQTPQP
jgi:hypothetical protein